MTIGLWFFWLFAALAAASLLSVVVVQLVAGFAIRRANRRMVPVVKDPEPVSVLKPIKGLDPSLEENLEAFANQGYPQFELVLGFEDPNDLAIPVVRQFQRRHPELCVQLVVGAQPFGMNPKVNNLAHMSRFAQYDLWLISDADVLPSRDYLSRLVAERTTESAGLVHSMLVGCGERSLGAALESIHMNTFVASTIWGASFARHNCVIGKSMLFHKQLLEELGGFRAVENVLAEDYVLGRAAQQNGHVVKLCTHPLAVRNPERSLSSFVNRHLRWSQMRRRVSLFAYLCEAVSYPTFWVFCLGLVVSAGVTDVLSRTAYLVLAAAFLGVKGLSDELMARSLRAQGVGLRHLPLIPLKDLLIAGVWLLGFFKRTVNWRGNIMVIGAGSQLSPLAKEGLAADRA